MRICILGGDGYLRWPTAMHFWAREHEVVTVDSMVKRHWEAVQLLIWLHLGPHNSCKIIPPMGKKRVKHNDA